MRLSQRLKDERQFVVKKLSGAIICQQCQATLDTFADHCLADLGASCEGFEAIENAKAEFDRQRSDGAPTDGTPAEGDE